MQRWNLEDGNIDFVFMPVNCTRELHLQINLRAQFQDWYAPEVLKTYDPFCVEIGPVKFPMSQITKT